MKKFKKVIPALCALLVSAVMLGSSTYAWFSMNKTVTATGMEVTAQANTQYFVITTALDGSNKFVPGNATEATLTKISGGITSGSNNVNPVALMKAGTTDFYTQGNDGNYLEKNHYLKSTTDTLMADGTWFTANSVKYDQVKGDGTTDEKGQIALKNIAEVDLGATNYFIKYTFYVGLANNSSAYTGKLKIEVTGFTDNGVSLAVVVGQDGVTTNKQESLELRSGNVSFETSGTDYNLTVAGDADAKYVQVDVYAYVYGFHTNVKDSVQNITGSLSIAVTGIDA